VRETGAFAFVSTGMSSLVRSESMCFYNPELRYCAIPLSLTSQEMLLPISPEFNYLQGQSYFIWHIISQSGVCVKDIGT
jgi:hypothetical protein